MKLFELFRKHNKNYTHALIGFAFVLGINLHANAGESDIAKLPTFVLAQSAGVLAPPVLLIGHNNAAPDMLRNLPQGFYPSIESYRGNDFNPSYNYEPPIISGSTRFPNVSITNAPVDGYMAYYAANLPANTAPYVLTDYFDGGGFFKNLTASYKNPLNQRKAGEYFYGTAATIDHDKPFFWKEYCPPTPPNPSCGYVSNYWPVGLHVIDSDTTISIYKFKTVLPAGCTQDPAPINMNCMVLEKTDTSFNGLYQKFANFYSYHSRNVFQHKNEFQYLFNSLDESTTIYCNQFNHTFPKILGSTWPYGVIPNPCQYDGFSTAPYWQGNGALEYAPPIITAADKETMLHYLMLSPLGLEPGATMDTNSFLGRINNRMQLPTNSYNPSYDLYWGRKNATASPNPEMSLNYCRKIYMYLADPLQFNSVTSPATTGGSLGTTGSQFNLGGADFYNSPTFLNSTYSSPYGKHSLYYSNNNEYSSFHKGVIDNVRMLYHFDGKTGSAAPNVIPRAGTGWPTGTNYWDAQDPANWQRVNTWSVNTVKKEYTAYNNYNAANNNYNFPDIYTVLRNAGHSVGTIGSLTNSLTADLEKPLDAGSTTAKGRSAGLTISGQILQDDGVQFGAFYDAADWSGRVEAHKLGSSGGKGDLVWTTSTAGNIPSQGARTIKTIARTNAAGTSGSVVDFEWSNLSALQKTALLTSDVADLVGTGNASSAGDWLVKYLRGDKTYEQNLTAGTGYFRKRNAPMGDVMSSTPVLVQARDLGFSRVYGDEGTSYTAFLAAERAKTKLLAVGANDGMLHLFNAATGSEAFAFVPSAVIPKLGKLAKPSYSHEYYVDGGLLHQHAYLGGTWRSLLVGSTGAGAKSVFVLDVTDRSNIKILFELTSDQVADLGFQFSIPRVARMPNGSWNLVHGNGFESTTGKAKLLLTALPISFNANPTVQNVNLPAAAGANNGLAPPAIWNDGVNAEVMYAGDKQGKLWRFNVNGGTVTTALTPLLNAVSSSVGNPVQPFTSKPDLALHPQGGLMVLAGTGSIYLKDDPANKATQTLYAVWDYPNPSFTGPASRSNMVQQSITTDGDFRATSATPFNFGASRGWFMDLKPNGSADTGERIIASPNVLFGRVMFNTYLPSVGTSGPGCQTIDEKSWFMSLDAFTGASPTKAIFDINTDGKINADDLVAGKAPSGQKIAATTSSVAIGLTYQNQKETTSGTPSSNQTYAGAPGSCSANHKSVKQGSRDMCVPKDACGKGFMWVKAGQNNSEALSSICINSNQQKPRLSWKQIQ